jgi:hypothetical protein
MLFGVSVKKCRVFSRFSNRGTRISERTVTEMLATVCLPAPTLVMILTLTLRQATLSFSLYVTAPLVPKRTFS